jgi:hypothetical protein
VARKTRYPVHHFEHSRDDLLQEVRILADDLFRDLVRKRQNVLQPIKNDRWNLVVFILFLQELDHQALPSVPDLSMTSTNLKCHRSNTEDCLCDWVQLNGVSIFLVSVWED